MSRISELFLQWSRMSLVLRILVGLIIGVIQDSVETALNPAATSSLPPRPN